MVRYSASGQDPAGNETTAEPTQEAAPPPGEGLSIGDLSSRTGVSVTTLRMWESRHGYPVPHRLPSGHRRYTVDDAQRIGDVVALRDSGRTLAAAIDEVLARESDRDMTPASAAGARHRGSVFAQLRQLHPGVATYELKRSTLLGLSWAIEDDFCARADRAHLFGAFEEPQFLERSRERWIALAKVAASAHVYASFGPEDAASAGGVAGPSVALMRDDAVIGVGRDDPDGSLYRVGLDEHHALRTEWIVVCDSAELPAALLARETPGPRGAGDRERRFESILTVDPLVVRDAARLCAAVAEEAGSPRARTLVEELAAPPVRGARIELPSVARLLGRLVSYVDAAR